MDRAGRAHRDIDTCWQVTDISPVHINSHALIIKMLRIPIYPSGSYIVPPFLRTDIKQGLLLEPCCSIPGFLAISNELAIPPRPAKMFKLTTALSLLPLLVLANPQYNYPPPPGSAPTTAAAAAAAPSAPPSTTQQMNVCMFLVTARLGV